MAHCGEAKREPKPRFGNTLADLEAADDQANLFLTMLMDDLVGDDLPGSERTKILERDPEKRVLILSAINLTRIGLYVRSLGADSRSVQECLTKP